MIEVERGGKHGDEFELELETRVAAMEGLGRVGFEGRRRGLGGERAGCFIHDGLTYKGRGLTPMEATGEMHETSTRFVEWTPRGRELRGAPNRQIYYLSSDA